MNIRNSFLEADCRGLKVLIIVPHQDDEINLAGASIQHFTEKGAQVFCVYTTNGDFICPAAARLEEARHSLQKLGVPREHIFCLGYGDTPNWRHLKHIFANETEPVVSPAGHKETYGAAGFADFCFKQAGHHHAYCRRDFKKDLKQVILAVKAQVILGIDADAHLDHRFCSLILAEIMGELLKEQPDYQPLLFKGFAYGTAFDAAADFYRANLLSTVKPQVGQSVNLNYDLHALSIYAWEERVRCPVSVSCRGHFLAGNVIFQALCCHWSQLAGWKAARIINGDQVFWQRRTDSLLPKAELQVSSGEGERVRDFKLWDSDDLDPKILPLRHYLWQPDEQDRQKDLEFTWQVPQKISLIKLYGSINDGNRVLGGNLCFNHNRSLAFGPLPENGAPLKVKVADEEAVTSLTIRLTQWQGTPSLAQAEAFAEQYQSGVLKPWLKITVQGDFIYDHWLRSDQDFLELGLYRYHYDGPCSFSIVQGENCFLKGRKLYFQGPCAKVIVRVEAMRDAGIFDQVIIRRRSKAAFAVLQRAQQIDASLTHLYLGFWRKYLFLQKRFRTKKFGAKKRPD